MRSLCLLVLLGANPSSALEATQQKPDKHRSPAKSTLRQWLSTGECVNLALVPQYNNQHSIWGLLQYFQTEGLLKHLKGISACSGGTLPGAFIAAGKDFDQFTKVFPQNGWLGFGPSEPKITEDYTNFLQGGLPKTFEELKIPFAISATAWNSETSLKSFVKKESHEMVLHSGELYPAMITAVATGNNGVIPDKQCPKCKNGFWPRKIGDQYPVTDGAFTDIWGTRGLTALPKCHRLLHVLPLDYPGQTDPQPANEIPGEPKELVTLVVTQPPVASHSYFHEKMKAIGLSMSEKNTQTWNELMFQKANEGLGKVVDSKMGIEASDPKKKTNHYVVLVDNAKELRKVENFKEKVYDAWMDTLRDNFWKFWGSQDGFGEEEKVDKVEAKAQKAK